MKNQRLFFALWPQPAVMETIQHEVIPEFKSCQGRITDAANWHITLAFFGNADNQTRQCLEQKAEQVRAQPFELDLSQCGFWKKPRVAWLAPNDVPEQLQNLVNDLQDAILPCGFEPEDRPYRPHVTLVRKAKRRPEVSEVKAINWEVKSFCLVESVSTPHGVKYQVLKEFPFL